MAGTAPILALPAELRLHIAELVFEQPRDAAFRLVGVQPAESSFTMLERVHTYQASQYLRPLLVCRLFYTEFRCIAYRKTMFAVKSTHNDDAARLPEELQRSIRKITPVYLDNFDWQDYPFNNRNLHLDELVIPPPPSHGCEALVGLLHRLQHVKMLTVYSGSPYSASFWMNYYQRTVGLVMKNDHYQRFDAPDAPHLEKMWWEWSYSPDELTLTFRALPPKPEMTEEAYMVFIKPHVDALMQDMAGM